MLSRKLVKKLADKKYRTETGFFLVEGRKSIFELLNSDFVIETLYGTPDFILDVEAQIQLLGNEKLFPAHVCVTVTEDELVSIGTLKSNNAGIAVAVQKTAVQSATLLDVAKTSIVLALDDVRDPGNFGTIIRTADWFGVTHVVTSETTADFYNPKTIAATMGSFTRVSVSSSPLAAFLKAAHDARVPIIGASLEGKNLYTSDLKKHGILVMGSESHGIGDDIKPYISEALMIPRYGNAESLNVSVATGIFLATLTRV